MSVFWRASHILFGDGPAVWARQSICLSEPIDVPVYDAYFKYRFRDTAEGSRQPAREWERGRGECRGAIGMRDRFAFIRRGKRRSSPGAPAPVQGRPEYRPNLFATEYDVRKHIEIPDTAEVRVEQQRTAPIDGFTPLPRCPHCGTAVAHSQVVCHGCGSGLGRL